MHVGGWLIHEKYIAILYLMLGTYTQLDVFNKIHSGMDSARSPS